MTHLTEILDKQAKLEAEHFARNKAVDMFVKVVWDRYKAGLPWDEEEINRQVKLELEKQLL